MKARPASRPPARCLGLLWDLSNYIEGELTPRRRHLIERHCRDCARCRVMVASLRRTVDVCRTCGGPRIPARLRARARTRIARLLRDLR